MGFLQLSLVSVVLLAGASAITTPSPAACPSPDAMPCTVANGTTNVKKPNIIFILTDDQDKRMGSTSYQKVLQSEVMAKGVTFNNHFGTVAQCCPARVMLLRGQAGHNTNNTHVRAPGGTYDKFVASGEYKDYLPMWLKKAGYRTEFLGKFLNGYTTLNYSVTPPGWDHIDALLDPYITNANNVVMSQNGERPISYHGFHQTDVLRVKALDRLDYMADQDEPFFLQISPTAPHVNEAISLVMPLKRHIGQFQNVTMPQPPSFNPPDDIQIQKPGYIKELGRMNSTEVAFANKQYQFRIESLLGIDEIIEDVVTSLEKKGIMDNTYIIYTSDNGYHLGTFRLNAGKAMPYIDDTNLPFVVRGPGIPQGVESNLPSTHIDIVPTLLDLAQLPKAEWPTFLDGRSLVDSWKNPQTSLPGQADGNSRELINIEFWGVSIEEVKGAVQHPDNSYKTIRVVGDSMSWFMSVWCTNEVELYDTIADPYEIHNLVNSTDPYTQRVKSRLNAILMLTKSCTQESCRDPWAYLQPNGTAKGDMLFSTLKQALDPRYDAWFSSFPTVHWNECLQLQLPSNEVPFFPAEAQFGLGLQFRENTDYYYTAVDRVLAIPPNGQAEGGVEQRNVTLNQIMEKAYAVSDDLLGVNATWIRSTNGLINYNH